MITVSEVVEQIIKNSFFLEEGLSKKIINLSSLARKIEAQVRKETLKEVSQEAIMMALKRLSIKIVKKQGAKNIFKKLPNMIVRSNLVEFTFANSSPSIIKLKSLFKKIDLNNKYFFTLTQGVFESAIITSQELEKNIEEKFTQVDIIHKIINLSAITISLPEENVNIPGVYYFILKCLAWEKINVIEVVSTYSEITIIFENENIDRAFSSLKKAFII